MTNHGQPIEPDTREIGRALAYNLMANFGFVFAHPWGKLWSLDLAGLLAGPRDAEGTFCRSVLDYVWVHPSEFGQSFPQIRATYSDIQEFVEACRLEYPLLSNEERALLDRWHTDGAIPPDVLTPRTSTSMPVDERSHADEIEHTQKLSRSDIVHLINESLSHSSWEGKILDLPLSMIEYYEKLNLRRPRAVSSDFAEIASVIRHGDIAVFDASSLFPADLFNISVEQLADFAGSSADRTAVLANGCKPTSLQQFGKVNSDALQRGARVAWSLADAQAISRDPPDINLSLAAEVDSVAHSQEQGQCQVGYIHTRRVPLLHERLPNVAAALGLEEEVLRTESFVWMGPIRGGFHYDEEANVYVQLSGESDVFLVPQNFTDKVSGGMRRFELPSREMLERDTRWKGIPLHMIRLKPGDGLTFPGRTFHLFLAQTYDRVAVNFFFLPKFRQMEYTEADWYAREARAPQGEARLAVRQLWARAFVRLYEKTGKGIVFMGEKNEYL